MRNSLYDNRLRNPLKTRVFATEKSVVRSIDTLSELTMYKYSSAIMRMYIYAKIRITHTAGLSHHMTESLPDARHNSTNAPLHRRQHTDHTHEHEKRYAPA